MYMIVQMDHPWESDMHYATGPAENMYTFTSCSMGSVDDAAPSPPAAEAELAVSPFVAF